MTQLTLFSPDTDALRQLHEAHAGLAAAHEALFDQYTALRKEHRDLQAALQAKERELTYAREAGRRILDEALHQVEFWQDLARAARPTTTPATLEPLLKRLLICAHPDKWAQGQPATALAHELTVILNDLRERKGGGQ